jgi:hypothetical protein
MIEALGGTTTVLDHGGKFETYVAMRLFAEFRSSIERSLAEGKPQWSATVDGQWVGELRFGGRTVRRVRHAAANLRRILSAFEEDGWPTRIDDPTPDGDSLKRYDAIKQLNKGLEGIRFRADGTGDGIEWRLADG